MAAIDDDGIAGAKSGLSLVTNVSVVFLVVLWLIPTIGLLVSSFRDRDAITASAWWKAPFAVEQNFAASAEGEFQQTPDGWL
ncbi:MAG: carbohydrate ABC transporter permease, partial [Pseudomonadota bacterium]